jgi:hypothetical protein
MAANLESRARKSRLLLKTLSRASAVSCKLQAMMYDYHVRTLLTVSIASLSYKARFLEEVETIVVSLGIDVKVIGSPPTRLHLTEVAGGK